MYEAFEKLPAAKKARILTISIEEFSEKGYEHTSTDTITSRVGISKGILFHYFKSKKNLYLYLLRHCIELLTAIMMEEMSGFTESDFFERIKAIIRKKAEIGLQYVYETQLLLNALTRPPQAIRQEVEELYRKHTETYGSPEMMNRYLMKSLLDEGVMREGVSAESVIKLTTAVLEKLTNEYLLACKASDFDPKRHYQILLDELEQIFAIMKYGIYQKK